MCNTLLIVTKLFCYIELRTRAWINCPLTLYHVVPVYMSGIKSVDNSQGLKSTNYISIKPSKNERSYNDNNFYLFSSIFDCDIIDN